MEEQPDVIKTVTDNITIDRESTYDLIYEYGQAYYFLGVNTVGPGRRRAWHHYQQEVARLTRVIQQRLMVETNTFDPHDATEQLDASPLKHWVEP